MVGDPASRATPAHPPVDGIAPPGGHYSHVACAHGFAFISGQLPIGETGEKRPDAPFDDQVRQVLRNLDAVLRAVGCGIAHLVQVRVYLADIDDWPRFNTLYAAWAGDARPARAIVPTGALHYGFRIEIEATAALPA
jgi:reactive intermediate/imine deaminase